MTKTRKKRNRKKRVNGYMVPMPLVSLLVLAGLAALAYLWMLSRCEAMGAEIKVLQTAEANLNEQYLNEDLRWTRLKSPQNLERILTRNGVKMDYPERDQVVMLADVRTWDVEDLDDGVDAQGRYAGVSRTGRYE